MFVHRVIPSRSRAASSAKINSFAEINHSSEMLENPVPGTIVSAAPKAIAEQMPRVKGLAKRLLRIVCISALANYNCHHRIRQSDIPGDDLHQNCIHILNKCVLFHL